jgi:hypothetical protein
MNLETIDARSLAFATLIAEKIEAQPVLVEVGRANLARWLKGMSPRNGSRATLEEWQGVIATHSLSELLELLRDAGITDAS